jgi:hypothetical protein
MAARGQSDPRPAGADLVVDALWSPILLGLEPSRTAPVDLATTLSGQRGGAAAVLAAGVDFLVACQALPDEVRDQRVGPHGPAPVHAPHRADQLDLREVKVYGVAVRDTDGYLARDRNTANVGTVRVASHSGVPPGHVRADRCDAWSLLRASPPPGPCGGWSLRERPPLGWRG